MPLLILWKPGSPRFHDQRSRGCDGWLHLRAYDGEADEVVWDVDTVRGFNTDYGIYFHRPGKVLLAYELAP